MKLLILSSLALALCNCAVTNTKINEALTRSPMHQEFSSSWYIQRGEKYVEMIPRGHVVDAKGTWAYAGETGVRWFVPSKEALGETERTRLQSQATEGSVAIQAANWVTCESLQTASEDVWQAALIGLGILLRTIAENSTDLIFE